MKKKAEYFEEDRIEHIHGYSHCRCRNKILSDGNFSCAKYSLKQVENKSRKYGLNEDQLCKYNSDQGYCKLSRIDEINLINTTEKSRLHLIVERISTEKGIKLLKTLMQE